MVIYKAGTKVITVIGSIEAIIVSVCITNETIEYKIRYFANGDEKIAWLLPFEIILPPPRKTAGFGNKYEEKNETILLDYNGKE